MQKSIYKIPARAHKQFTVGVATTKLVPNFLHVWLLLVNNEVHVPRRFFGCECAKMAGLPGHNAQQQWSSTCQKIRK